MKFSDIKPKPGLKIRRVKWEVGYYWMWKCNNYFDDLHLINKKGNAAKICRSDVMSNDWVYFEEEKEILIKEVRGILDKLEKNFS